MSVVGHAGWALLRLGVWILSFEKIPDPDRLRSARAYRAVVMTPRELELARQVVTAPWFRWGPGMSDHFGRWRVLDKDGANWRTDGSILPDLSDLPTAVALLDLLGHRLMATNRRHDPDSWSVHYSCADGHRVATTGWRNTLGEAAAVALLVVNGPTTSV